MKKKSNERSENPIESYHLIKRFASIWSNLNEFTSQDKSKGNTMSSSSQIINSNNKSHHFIIYKLKFILISLLLL